MLSTTIVIEEVVGADPVGHDCETPLMQVKYGFENCIPRTIWILLKITVSPRPPPLNPTTRNWVDIPARDDGISAAQTVIGSATEAVNEQSESCTSA